MSRFLFTLFATVAAVSAAVADLGPRPKGLPPTKGIGLPVAERLIPVNNVLKFANEFPNHTFWAVTQGFNGTNVVTLKPDTDKPLPLTMNLTVSAVVYAVPNDVAKTFATPKEFVEAVAANKLPAGVKGSPTFVKSQGVLLNDRRSSIDRVVIISGGLKNGIKFAEEDPIMRDPEPEPEPAPAADVRPAPRLFVVGIAAALAVATAGVWLARKGK